MLRSVFRARIDDDVGARVRALAARPVLVVGAPRSGTTWVQRLLLADPRFCGGQESHFFATFGRVLRDFDRKRDLPRPHGLAHYWSRSDLIEALRELWLRTARPIVDASPAATVLVEKTPDHALFLDVVREVVPEARVVHVVRDSRAVCASLLAAGRAPWGRDWAPKSVPEAIRVWTAHVEGALREADRVTAVRYEDLRRAPVERLARLRAALGEPAARETLETAVEAASIESVGSGAGGVPAPSAEPEGFVRAGRVDGWRTELGFLARHRIWRETRELMLRLGYDEHGACERD